MSESDSNGSSAVLSRKELARLQRRAAYQRAKEWRAKDPKQIAMKLELKQRRRDAYQKVKERRKAAAGEQKAKQKQIKKSVVERASVEKRASADQELMKMVTRAAKGSWDVN
jgi:hypothetical protein